LRRNRVGRAQLAHKSCAEKLCDRPHGGTNPDADAQVNYRQFDDAVEVAHTLGAQPTDQTTDDGERVRDYLFPDGSTTRIIVQADNIGSGII